MPILPMWLTAELLSSDGARLTLLLVSLRADLPAGQELRASVPDLSTPAPSTAREPTSLLAATTMDHLRIPSLSE